MRFLRGHLFGEQYGGVAVLLAGLRAQSDEPEQEQRQTGAPDHQLPVIVTLQERFVDVQQLEGETGERRPVSDILFVEVAFVHCSSVFKMILSGLSWTLSDVLGPHDSIVSISCSLLHC